MERITNIKTYLKQKYIDKLYLIILQFKIIYIASAIFKNEFS